MYWKPMKASSRKHSRTRNANSETATARMKSTPQASQSAEGRDGCVRGFIRKFTSRQSADKDRPFSPGQIRSLRRPNPTSRRHHPPDAPTNGSLAGATLWLGVTLTIASSFAVVAPT